MDTRNFLQGTLVSWLKMCLDDATDLEDYESLLDGDLIHKVFLKIDPSPKFSVHAAKGLESLKLENLQKIIDNVNDFYKKHQMMLLVQPDIEKLVFGSMKDRITELELMLSILLGCAFVCSNKLYFISIMEKLEAELPEKNQRELVDYYKNLEAKYIIISEETHPGLVCNIKKMVKDNKSSNRELLQQENLNRKELVLYKSQSRDYSEKIAKLEEALQESEYKRDVVEDVKKNLLQENKLCKSKNKSLCQENYELKEALEQSKTEEEILQNKITLKNKELEKAEKTIKIYKDRCDELRESTEIVNKLETENKQLKDKLIYCNDSANQLKLENNHSKAKVESLRAKVESLKEQVLKITRMKSHITDSVNQIQALKAKNVELINAANNVNQDQISDVNKTKTCVKMSKDLPLLKRLENLQIFYKSHWLKGHTNPFSSLNSNDSMAIIDLFEELQREEKLKNKLFKSTKKQIEGWTKNFFSAEYEHKYTKIKSMGSSHRNTESYHQELSKILLKIIEDVMQADQIPGFGLEMAQNYRLGALNLLKKLLNSTLIKP